MKEYTGKFAGMTIGLDLGDKYGQYYTLDEGGDNIDAGRVTMRVSALEKRFGSMERSRIVMESGTHSGWVSRLLESLGHEVIVANARKLRLISENENKDDAVDAELLARLGRVDPKLLYPIQHRGAGVQADLALLRAREALVKVRGQLINHMRGAVKSLGGEAAAVLDRQFSPQGRSGDPGRIGSRPETVAGDHRTDQRTDSGL